MDDLLYTAETVEEILQVKDELTQILSSVGIPLRKFLSNASEVLENSSNSDASFSSIPLGERSNAKALGLSWNALSDTIYYSITFKNTGPSNTKRTILSMVSQCFDPLGLLSPVIITGKILIQKLWELKLAWDESVPHLINSEWNQFQNELIHLRDLQIPRCVIPISANQVELHGFSDSSSNAYGACIYVRCRNGTRCSSRLLCSKSRVAPLRVISIPRLELCAAVLLAELMQKVTASLAVDANKVFLWTDSTVVLNWLNSAANRYKTFIANRIAAVQEIFNSRVWHHVKSQENPADLVSRVISASNILINSLWWNGPEFLSSTDEFWKNTYFSPDLETSECKSSFTAVIQSTSDAEEFEMFDKFSSFSKLQRVLAYVNRFISNCKVSLAFRISGSLTTDELQHSSNLLVKICQRESFPNEIKQLLTKNKLKAKSNILSLNPFLDEFQLLRVGGRIRNSEYNSLLLPSNHALTRLIMKHYHITLLHCGPQQLLACVRETYWPISEPCLLDLRENRLSLYQRSQRIVQHFWKRWSIEVIPDLQRRTKWFQNMQDLLHIGSLVLIQEDNTPPLSWSLGRVVEIHRAPDGVIRSATNS
ncbi:hypothetical protein PPYR_12494 [Photinus pyralis]|uniref:DUF5641 domain-containing protein n=1 Tax=Photinus pyralis TaxID=7054 RepID=A0A5N4AEA2_PHOPY|nr:hypothetical protein PPYR_12494 [Photinus pyralis]